MSAKFNWMLERELTGLRYSYEEAGPIIEDLDSFGSGAICTATAEPRVLQLHTLASCRGSRRLTISSRGISRKPVCTLD